VRTNVTSRRTAAVPVLMAVLAIALVSCGGSPSEPSAAPATVPATTTALPAEFELPIVFVHSFFGSGAQYRTQALRFASNGFPPERIRAFDYGTLDPDPSKLNEFLDGVRREFGVSKVRLVGHALGTAVLARFVGEAANAAGIDKFILVDGAACPAGNPSCLEIRAASMGQTIVEASTSAESFARQYRFFIGRDPLTTKVEAEPPDQVEIAGKALDLQVNTPPAGATAEVWEIDPRTGARVGSARQAAFDIGTDGSWGPIKVNGTKHYEIALSRPGSWTGHYYYQPFIRSSYIVRLNTVAADSPTAQNTNFGADHSVVAVTRYREWWRTHGADNDTLQISATGQPPVDMLAQVNADSIGIHIQDDAATPRQTTAALLPFFPTQPFQTGVDVYLPAGDPPRGTITLTNAPRGDTTRTQTLAAPNWPSSTDFISFEFNDYVQ
jgi:pimeloyl-ACP methyl ester carboxylesterase